MGGTLEPRCRIFTFIANHQPSLSRLLLDLGDRVGATHESAVLNLKDRLANLGEVFARRGDFVDLLSLLVALARCGAEKLRFERNEARVPRNFATRIHLL